MRKVKILYVIDKMHTGGSQKHILQLLHRIDRDKFEPHLCCLHYGGKLIQKAESLCVKILVLDIKRIYDLSGIMGILKLVNFIKKERIDIVHTFLFSGNVIGNIAGRLGGASLVVSGRRDTGVHREGKWRHRQTYKIAHRFADRVFTVSNAVREVVHRDEGVPLERIVTLYNGADIKPPVTNAKSQLKKTLGIKENESVVGMIARLTWVKGHKYFIESAKLVLKDSPDTKFLIIGDGPLRDDLQSTVRNERLSNHIIFLGNRSDVTELLKIMDVSVNASYSEGMSNVILESMSCGIPVVATDVDGNREVVRDNETGFLVPAKDAAAISNKTMFLLKNKRIAGQMGQNARKLIEDKFNASKIVQDIETVYADLLKEKRNEHCYG